MGLIALKLVAFLLSAVPTGIRRCMNCFFLASRHVGQRADAITIVLSNDSSCEPATKHQRTLRTVFYRVLIRSQSEDKTNDSTPE